jgi:hypothetical protein
LEELNCSKSKLQITWVKKKLGKTELAIYFGASTAAEFIADLFLCLLEAIRINEIIIKIEEKIKINSELFLSYWLNYQLS